jgi:hypothetical protein
MFFSDIVIVFVFSNAPRKLSDRFDRIVHAAPAAKSNQHQNQKGKKVVVVAAQKKGSNPKPTAKGAKGKGNTPASGKKDTKKKDAKKGGKCNANSCHQHHHHG